MEGDCQSAHKTSIHAGAGRCRLIDSGETKGGVDMDYQVKLLPIVIAPMIFMLLAMTLVVLPTTGLWADCLVALGMVWMVVAGSAYYVKTKRMNRGGEG